MHCFDVQVGNDLDDGFAQVAFRRMLPDYFAQFTEYG
jgi:hypothetical protein